MMKDGVYHCDMKECPYRASWYCMVTCKGVKKTEDNTKEKQDRLTTIFEEELA